MLANEKCSHHKRPCPPRPPCPPCPPPCPPRPDPWEEFCKACHKYCDKNHCEPPCKDRPCPHGGPPSWKPADAPQAGCVSCWALGQNGPKEDTNDYGQEAARDYGRQGIIDYGQEAARNYGREGIRDYGQEQAADPRQNAGAGYAAGREYGQEMTRDVRQEDSVAAPQNAPVQPGYAVNWAYTQDGIWVYYPRSVWSE